jgi:DNA topoisomerase VI subunit B
MSFIYVDPNNDEYFYPRRVSYFPKEPTYALPHPSSIKIGDFQDLLRGSENLTVQAFLTDNFVRLSSKLAKSILSTAEFEIECKLRFFNLGSGFLTAISKPTDIMTYTREESHVYGRSNKPRKKYVGYLIDGELKDKFWVPIQEFNQLMKIRHSLQRKLKFTEKSLLKPDLKKKEIKDLEKVLKKTNSELDVLERSVKKLKTQLNVIAKSAKLTEEIKHSQTMQKIEEIISYLLISKTKPSELNQIQIENLYMAFKNQSYLAPPTDTAIPVGESALETAVIKQYNLTVSNRVDYYGNSEDSIHQIGDYERIKSIHRNLSKFNLPSLIASDENPLKIFEYNPTLKPDAYSDVIAELDLVHTIGDDFVAANTRRPTSGKGLAFVVETVMAYSPNKISSSKKASQVVTRYVNRTPKMRDNADCALWQGVQNVNWKNYKVSDTFDNGIPKGNYVIYINCSGPYTHLMFKSQSKNALAEDEILIKEVKYSLEAIGRKLRQYMNKKEIRDKRSKRSKVIERNIPIFVNAIYNIAQYDEKYLNLKKTTLEQKINEVLNMETDPTATESEIREAKKVAKSVSALTKLQIAAKEIDKQIPTREPPKTKEPKPVTPQPKPTPSVVEPKLTPSPSHSTTPSSTVKLATELTDDKILQAISDNNWHPTSDIVKILGITSVFDARLLRTKLKVLAMKQQILLGQKQGKDVWKRK